MSKHLYIPVLETINTRVSVDTDRTNKGIVMYNLRKIVAVSLFIVQCAVVVWLSQRTDMDVFSQLILLPLLLVSGLALLSLNVD